MNLPTPLDKAVDCFGSDAALGREIGMSRSAIGWMRKTKVSPEAAVEIERVTKGKVTRSELRPDLFGAIA